MVEFLRIIVGEDVPLLLPARAHLALIEECVRVGLSGGAIHDALIAATASHAGARLLTRDRRASTTYSRLGVAHDFLD